MGFLLDNALYLILSQQRAKKHKLHLIFNTKSTQKKQDKNILYLNSKLNQVSVLTLLDWHLPCQVSGNGNSASNYILIFGKLFHTFKLMHVDLKPRILIASFLVAPLFNN